MEEIRAERSRRAIEAERARLARDLFAIRARCATLAGFVKEAWHVVEPNTPLVWNWHLDAMCQHLEAITDGRLKRLLINVPPGSSKTLLVSVLWPAWEWGPRGMRGLRYLTTSFAEESVKSATRKHRDLILSEWYGALWPDVRLVRTAEMSFANADTGTREGSAFGSLTSKRGDRLIIDDPHSTKTAESDAERQATVRQFLEGAMNRLNDQLKSAIVVVMQRLHQEDVSGAILSRKLGFEHLCLPMEYEPDRACETSIGFVDPRTEEGELLDPQRFPRAAVADLKLMGEYAYAGQYQQRPAPREGGLFKRSWFRFVGAVPAGHRKRVRAWDLAATKKTATNNPDWTAGVRVSYGAEKTFLIEGVVRFRGSPMEVDATVKSVASTDGQATAIRLTQDPGQAGKAQAETMVRDLAGYSVFVKPATGDKATRATPAAVQCEAGNVLILQTGDPDRDAWIEPFLNELCLFPAAAHDDQVDAFADAINELALGSMYDIGAF